jgi:hypothetical protein
MKASILVGTTREQLGILVHTAWAKAPLFPVKPLFYCSQCAGSAEGGGNH